MPLTSKQIAGIVVGILLAFAPVSASAGTITTSIGSFLWTTDFFGDSLSLQNDSAAAPGLAADFADLSILLTPGYDEDGDGSLDPAFQAFPTTLSSAIGENSYFESFAGPLASVRLQFRYSPGGLPEMQFDQTFNSVDDLFFAAPFLNYSYTVPDPPPTSTPEPSSLILLMAGAGALLGNRSMRQQTKP